MGKLLQEFIDIVGDKHVLHGGALSQRPTHFLDPSPMVAAVLVRPNTTEQVSAIMAVCHAHGQTVVTHGGLTGLAGGNDTEETDVILSLERMNSVEEIDTLGNTLTVQAGCILETVQKVATDNNKLFPLDLGARGSATIGGNIATNAGGLAVLRYGMMREQVLGLEAVLADGTVVSSLNHLLKNNTGYDLKQLFIGSEGTLGVVTRAVLRLRPAANSVQTAMFAFEEFSQVTNTLDILATQLSGQLSAFEVIWNGFYRVSTDDKHNAFAPPLDNHYPIYAIAETTGNNLDRDQQAFQQAIEQAAEAGAIVDAVIAQSSQQARQIWEIRENVQSAMKFPPTFRYDISLPIANMDQYVTELEPALLSRWPDLKFYCFGHLADCNLHLELAPQDKSAQSDEQIEQLHKDINAIVYQPLSSIGGSVSAEHGIGTHKKAYLKLCRSATEIAMMRQLKQALDPKGVLNPGKIFD